jgi:hypothetical protein
VLALGVFRVEAARQVKFVDKGPLPLLDGAQLPRELALDISFTVHSFIKYY